MRWPALAAVVLACAATSGCGGREGKISELSLSFMTKDPSLEARRAREASHLIKLGVFHEDMSPDQVKQVLGAPTFVWRAEMADAADMGGYELQYVYRLDGATSLRADFSSSRLKRLRRQLEIRSVEQGEVAEFRLQPKPR
jgi:hypothetical protein